MRNDCHCQVHVTYMLLAGQRCMYEHAHVQCHMHVTNSNSRTLFACYMGTYPAVICMLRSSYKGVATSELITPQLAGKAHQLGCPKIVLDHVHVYLYIYIYNIYVCAHHNA